MCVCVFAVLVNGLRLICCIDSCVIGPPPSHTCKVSTSLILFLSAPTFPHFISTKRLSTSSHSCILTLLMPCPYLQFLAKCSRINAECAVGIWSFLTSSCWWDVPRVVVWTNSFACQLEAGLKHCFTALLTAWRKDSFVMTSSSHCLGYVNRQTFHSALSAPDHNLVYDN